MLTSQRYVMKENIILQFLAQLTMVSNEGGIQEESIR